eukprot:6477375-Amphidinium_carterae.1
MLFCESLTGILGSGKERRRKTSGSSTGMRDTLEIPFSNVLVCGGHIDGLGWHIGWWEQGCATDVARLRSIVHSGRDQSTRCEVECHRFRREAHGFGEGHGMAVPNTYPDGEQLQPRPESKKQKTIQGKDALYGMHPEVPQGGRKVSEAESKPPTSIVATLSTWAGCLTYPFNCLS